MFVISKSRFAQMGEASFVERVRGVLLEAFPEQVDAIPAAELNAEILRQARRAEAYGLKSEASAATFVITAWMLGLDFDTRFADVHRTLNSTWLTQDQKSSWLESSSVKLLQLLTH
jgi:hypothetical protein